MHCVKAMRDDVPRAKTYQNAAYEFYRRIGAPRFIMAPMVGGSETPFRMMCRRYGVQLAYTPMLKADYCIQNSAEYIRLHFTESPEDRPLIAQLCANNASTLVCFVLLLWGPARAHTHTGIRVTGLHVCVAALCTLWPKHTPRFLPYPARSGQHGDAAYPWSEPAVFRVC